MFVHACVYVCVVMKVKHQKSSKLISDTVSEGRKQIQQAFLPNH